MLIVLDSLLYAFFHYLLSHHLPPPHPHEGLSSQNPFFPSSHEFAHRPMHCCLTFPEGLWGFGFRCGSPPSPPKHMLSCCFFALRMESMWLLKLSLFIVFAAGNTADTKMADLYGFSARGLLSSHLSSALHVSILREL